MGEAELVAITIRVSAETAAKVDELADRMGASQSRMASMLMEEGLKDNEWIIRFVTTRTMKGLRETLRSLGGKKRKVAKGE